MPDVRDARAARRARALRRLGVMAFVVLVGFALVGLLGPRQATASATENGYTVDVRYPQVTRSGLVSPLRVRVSHEGGFAGPIALAFDDALFDRFDFQNWYPNPDAETGTPDRVEYEFQPPSGDVFALSLDARTGPTQPPSAYHYWVAVLVEGREVARVGFRVWVMP